MRGLWSSAAVVAVMFGVMGCGTDSTSVATTAAALETAQCDLGNVSSRVTACTTDYSTCIAAEGADLAACRATLESCLAPPHRDNPGDGDGGMCGGRGPGGPGGPGGPPPDLDGGLPPPPHDGAGGPLGPPPDLDGGRPPHGGRGGRGPHPDRAALQACRDGLDACLTANPADLTCIDTSRECVKAAFDAAFAAACADATTRCANDTSEPCTRILARCADGASGTNATCSAN
ncbi:MAG: hypothetical protein U0228_38825 [Myxococcaceae bacterium]